IAALCVVFCGRVSAETTVVLEEDFESFQGTFYSPWTFGYTSVGRVPLWGSYDSSWFDGEEPHGGQNMAHCCFNVYGGGTYIEGLPYHYENDQNNWISTSINLSNADSASLSFWYKIPGIDSGSDFCRVYIDEELIWEVSSVQSSWAKVQLNLDSFVGTSCTLKFNFVSDGSTVAEGWFLDDILVTKEHPLCDIGCSGLSVSRDSLDGSDFGACTFKVSNSGPDFLYSLDEFRVDWWLSSDGSSQDTKMGYTYHTDTVIWGSSGGAVSLSASQLSELAIPSSVGPGTYYIIGEINSSYFEPYTLEDPNTANNDMVSAQFTYDPVPVNDDFWDAIVLPSAGGTFYGKTSWASMESWENWHGRSYGCEQTVWYQWTSPISSTVTIDADGGSVGLVVYTLNKKNYLIEEASDHDSGMREPSVTFKVKKGVVYRIVIAGDDTYNGHSGPFELNVDAVFPDYEISTVTIFPENPIPGKACLAKVTVVNNGEVTGQSVPVEINHAGGTQMVSFNTGNLKAGKSKTFDVKLVAENGVNSVSAAIDPEDSVIEENEGNNSISVNYTAAADANSDGFSDAENDLVLSLKMSGKALTPETAAMPEKILGFLVIDSDTSPQSSVYLAEKAADGSLIYSSYSADVDVVRNEHGDLALRVTVDVNLERPLSMGMIGKSRSDSFGLLTQMTLAGDYNVQGGDSLGTLDALSVGIVKLRLNRLLSGKQDGGAEVVQWLQSKGYVRGE
ncbi:MAG: CARDB domain-containing protein, partial [Sphaerochaetaceae bacterium]